jgi:hypothetical protein
LKLLFRRVPHDVLLARTAILGARASCAHWHHCRSSLREEGFTLPGAADDLRRLALHRALGDDAPVMTSCWDWESDRPHRDPRVTIVQRSNLRAIDNLGQLMRLVMRVTGTPPNVVDMAQPSVLEQIRIAYESDVIIMAHGGALAHLTWMAFGAVLIDIYPYNFPAQYGSALVHWVRRALPESELLHHPFEITEWGHGEYTWGRLEQDCVCPGDFSTEEFRECSDRLFWHLLTIHVDSERFARHLETGIQAWRDHSVVTPPSRAEYERGNVGATPWYWNPNGGPICETED